MRKISMGFAVALVFLTAGCARQRRDVALKQVAKDWCMTIRASQVIPVYPLTEDLQPGDVFLVQSPVDRQHREYEERGFLSLDNHLARLDPGGYGDFYDHSFDGDRETMELPGDWLDAGTDGTAWAAAPDAAFPTYRFSVRGGGGFNLALPVQGVPVGLSLLGSGAAEGTITIAGASTYGVDHMSLYREVREWADGSEVRSFLSQFGGRQEEIESGFLSALTALWSRGDRESKPQKPNYLRVITRVYLTGRLDVSLQSSEAMAAGLEAGAPRPINVPAARTGEDPGAVTAKEYADHLKELNSMLEATAGRGAPGGAVQITSASAGSISLRETFERPLVIGYLGFDMRIGPDGGLGPPVPTHAVLQGTLQPRVSLEFTEGENKLRSLLQRVRSASEADRLRRQVVRELGGEVESIYLATSEEDRQAAFPQLIHLYWAPGHPGKTKRTTELIAVLKRVLEE
jgi:hypothetical protein